MHELLVVRHAIAQDRLDSARHGIADAQRPLTTEGRKKMALGVRGLQRLMPQLDTILSSPLLRAAETARLISERYRSPLVETLDSLAPQYATHELVAALNQQRHGVLAIVGHEPGLGKLLAALCCGKEGAAMPIKKGGVALLRFAGPIATGRGELQWLLTPKQLRLLGKGA